MVVTRLSVSCEKVQYRTMATSYKIGSIAQLIGGGGGGGDGEEVKQEQDNKDDLFTTDKKQKDRPQEDILVSPKKKTKRKKPKDEEEQSEEDEAKPNKKSKKAQSEGDEPQVKYYTAKYEDKKERVSDADADARTVFVGNLRSDTKPKKLRALFKPFGTVESVRLRCAARPDPNTAKRVAVIKRSFHQARTNINAFVKFSKPEEAQNSCKLNGTKFNE